MKKFFILSWLVVSGVLAQTITPPPVTIAAELNKVGVTGTPIASASSINLGAATGQTVHITGTTTITALGTAASGIYRRTIIDSGVTFTYNATSLITFGNANFDVGLGSVIDWISLGSGNWRMIGVISGTGSIPLSDSTSSSSVDLNTLFGSFGAGSAYSIDPSTGQIVFDGFNILSDGAGNLSVQMITGSGAGLYNIPTSALSGTTTNDNAATGKLGEFATTVVAVGSAVSLTSGVSKTVTSVSLTAGDWDVTGVVDYHPNSLTTGSYFEQGVSTTTNALGSQDQFTAAPMALAAGLGVDPALNAPVTRLALASTTTVYLTCQAGFAVSTLTAYGTIRARRVR